MKTIIDLQNQYDELKKVMHNLSKEITQHLHDVYDPRLDLFKTYDDFLDDINNYAGDTFGKLMYINHVKNIFDKR